MEYFIKNTVQKFESFLETINDSHRGDLVSFMYNGDIDYQLVNPEKFSNYFQLNKPEDNFSVKGIDEAVDIITTKLNSYSSLQESIEELKDKSFNNFDEYGYPFPPLFLSYKKFDFEKRSKMWEDFNNFSFFVPKLLLIKNSSAHYFIFNFIYKNPQDKIFAKQELITYLEKIISNNSINNSEHISKTITDAQKDSDWKELVNIAVNNLSNGKLNKIVLSRFKKIGLKQKPNWQNLLLQLTDEFPQCYIFLLRSGDSFFIGASPEKFLTVNKNSLYIEAVAGSAPKGKNKDEDFLFGNNLLRNKKIEKEHSIVAEYVEQILKLYSKNLQTSTSPEILKLEYIQHVVTKFSAEIEHLPQILNLIDELFPTPAVCGFPKNNAIELIRKLEKHDRGLYSGLIGWMNFNVECDFTVAIRSALVKQNEIFLFAGAGIVSESDADDEYLETELKLKPMHKLFSNENKS